MKKRGLSNLIATVLIVLLALAAVAIIWGFLRPTIEGTGPQIDLGIKCVEVEVEPTACVSDSASNEVNVTVKLKAGTASDIIAAVDFDDGSSASVQETAPSILSTTRISITCPAGSGCNVAEVRAAGIVSDTAGNTKICPESPAVLTTCT